MANPTSDDLRKFAEDVERLCDFLLKDIEKEDDPDQNALRKLKQDAADWQHVKIQPPTNLDGLDRYLRGHPPKE